MISEETTSCAQDETRTHTILRPLPPQSSVYTNFTTCACPEQDSNLHTSRHAHLKRTRLPIPPSGQKKRAENETRTRDPNLGKVVLYQLSYFRILSLTLKIRSQCFFSKALKERFFLGTSALDQKAGAKVLLFFDIRKFFGKKMQKKCNYSHPRHEMRPVESIKTGIWRSRSLPSCVHTNHRCHAHIGVTQRVHQCP